MLQAKQQGLVPRCLAVITPGNPTGQVIEQDNQEELIKFAKEHDLAIIADEVYQVSCLGPGHISGSVVARSDHQQARPLWDASSFPISPLKGTWFHPESPSCFSVQPRLRCTIWRAACCLDCCCPM